MVSLSRKQPRCAKPVVAAGQTMGRWVPKGTRTPSCLAGAASPLFCGGPTLRLSVAPCEGFAASLEFLRKLQALAVEELGERRRGIIAELAELGVEVGS